VSVRPNDAFPDHDSEDCFDLPQGLTHGSSDEEVEPQHVGAPAVARAADVGRQAVVRHTAFMAQGQVLFGHSLVLDEISFNGPGMLSSLSTAISYMSSRTALILEELL
jgi:hypothetical protein